MANRSPKRRLTRKMEQIKKRMIVFSSQENISLAEAIQRNLYIGTYTTRVWTNGFFALSQSYISNFQDIQYEYDFAVVICGADDAVVTRGKKKKMARDNVLLELGMCISSFTLNRVIIVKHKDIKLPSDLDGISAIEYNELETDNIDAIAGTICSQITNYVERNKFSKRQYGKLSWDEYFHYMKKVIGELGQSIPLGGYEYDAIIGINRGGLMAADLIARENAQNIPVLPLFADRRSGNSSFVSPGLFVSNEELLKCLDNAKICNILLVDSFTRDGISVIEGKKYLQNLFPDKVIKSAVIYANSRLPEDILRNIDYTGNSKDLDGKKLSLD